MSKEIINIGIVSKGRLKEESEKIFKKKKLKIYYNKRELLGRIKNRKNIRVLFLHAREIIEQIAIGKLDIGISGFDLLRESEINVQKNVKVEKVNPQLEVIYYGTINLEKKGVEKTATRFNISQDGKVNVTGNLFKKLVPEN